MQPTPKPAMAEDQMSDEIKTGYYFEFKRGTWSRRGTEPIQYIQGSGFAFTNNISKEKQAELDRVISACLNDMKTETNASAALAAKPAVSLTDEQIDALTNDHYKATEDDDVEEDMRFFSDRDIRVIVRAAIASVQAAEGQESKAQPKGTETHEKPAWLAALESREREHAASASETDQEYAAGIRDAMTAYTLNATQAPAPAPAGSDKIAAKHRSDEMQTVDEAWEFWRPVICNEDGSLNMEQLKLELCDAANFMGFAASVYDYATGGMCTKVNTLPSVVKSLIDDHITEVCEENEAPAPAPTQPAAEPASPAIGQEQTERLIEQFEYAVLAMATGRDDASIRLQQAKQAVRAAIAQAAPANSTQEDYEHFLSYSGLADDAVLRYAYFHGANNGIDKPQAAPAQTWQPIATAPKDGTQVLVTWASTWEKGTPHLEACEAGELGHWFYSYDGDTPTIPPTHYMHLPAAPLASKEST